jgi:drug/metabolite transporter (DMT)-like permease
VPPQAAPCGPRRVQDAGAGRPRLQTRWNALPGSVRGPVLILASCFLLTGMAVIVKTLGDRLDSFELAFVRALFGFLIALAFVPRAGLRALRTHHFKGHLGRALAGAIGVMCGFYALTHLALAEATAIGFTQPLFTVLLAGVLLHELVGPRRWLATVVGFLGVLVMLRPAGGLLETAALVALLGALAAAVVRLLIKQLSATEAPLTILLYQGLMTSLITAIPALLVWRTPSLAEIALMVVGTACGSLAQLCMIQGYAAADASALAPFDYARLPIAALFGFFLFAEVPDLYALLGALLIVASTLYIALREAHLRRAARVPAAD